MELYEIKKETATRWAFGSRIIKNDLNYLEVAGVEVLTARALDELAERHEIGSGLYTRGIGKRFLNGESAWAGGVLWACYSSQNIAEFCTLKTGERLRCACVVGLALLLVFEEPNTENEKIYRIIE